MLRSSPRTHSRPTYVFQIYASWCAQNPSKARVVAVCEPRPYRLAKVADESDVSQDLRFSDWKPLAALGRKIADAVVIAILDGEHAECVEVFAKLGYAILCEKVNHERDLE